MPRSTTPPVVSARRTQAERRAATRAALTTAALEALASAGYSATKVSDVANRAGVSVGAALHYFPQKIDLAIGAIEDGLAAAVQTLQTRVEEAKDSPDRDVRVLDAIYEIFEGTVYQAFLAVQVHARSDPALYPRLAELVQRSIDELTKGVIDGCGQELALAPRLPVLMGLITATVRGIAIVDPADPHAPHDKQIWEMARGWFASEIDMLRREADPTTNA